MPAKDLNNPLHSRTRRPRRRLPHVFAPVLVSAAILIAVAAAVWVAVVDDPDGGRSVAVAVIQETAPAATGSIASGDGLDIAPGEAGPGAPVLPEDSLALMMPPDTPLARSARPHLIEQSAFGPLPRVAPDGTRPRDAYARRTPGYSEGTPRIVVVVGGLGLSQTGTQNAIERLPEDVTLAFAPYGASLQRWVDMAREEGHEVVLQIPLEPVGYPEQNPGEHTLLVSAGPERRDDLHWNLGRMTSYAGVMNYMGARFSRDENALVPFLGEIGERGLYYIDDGTAPGSLAYGIGEALRVPVVTADLVIDRDRSEAAILQQLAALEAVASTRGVAVGVASAFPASIEAIASWAEEAAGRGVVVVPASAALGR